MIALCNHIGASTLLETSLFSSAFENTSASDIVRVIHLPILSLLNNSFWELSNHKFINLLQSQEVSSNNLSKWNKVLFWLSSL